MDTGAAEQKVIHIDPNFKTFMEQRSLVCLQSLQRENQQIRTEPQNLKATGKSNFYPIQSRPPVLDTFQELVERDLKLLFQQNRGPAFPDKANITRAEHQALKELSDNPNIVTRLTWPIVVLDSDHHILDDPTTSRLLSDSTKVLQIKMKPLPQDGINSGILTN